MDITGEFFKEGILGAIIVVLGTAIAYQQRQIQTLNEKRIADVEKFSSSFVAASEKMIVVSKDLLAANAVLQRTVDTMSTAVQNLLNSK